MMRIIFSKGFKKVRMVLFSIIVLFLFIGCGGGEPPSTKVDPQIFVVPGGTEKRLISEEQIPQNNCPGNVPISQTIERKHSIIYNLQLENGVTVSADGRAKIPAFGEVGVGAAVATKYQVGYGVEESLSRSITVGAEGGSNIQHTIRQYEIWETGNMLIVMGETSEEIPYSFRRDFSIESLEPANLGGCLPPSQKIPSNEGVTLEQLPTATLQNNSTPLAEIDSNLCPPLGSPDAIFPDPLSAMGTPADSAGTGIFANAVRPWGTQPVEYSYVKDALNKSCIQLISPIDSDSNRHCMTSQYNTNRIWIGTAQKGTSLLVKSNDSEEYEIIGQIDKIAPDARSYLVEYTIDVGDEICLGAPPGITMGDVYQAGGYHLMIGRDLSIFTNSWCMMLENDGSQHWCQ